MAVRADLNARGTKTIRSIGRAFKIIDDSQNRSLDKQELYWGLKDMGCTFSKKEAGILLDCLDVNNDGFVSYDEFLIGIRGRPNANRQAVIDKAFAKFNRDDHDDVITASDLAGVYDCSKHPKVISGNMTENEVFTEFLSSFGDKNNDGKITHSEWNDYYAAVSSSIDNDEHFSLLMHNAWKM
jgi:Ca2+-binding EF-hand superfamily protein